MNTTLLGAIIFFGILIFLVESVLRYLAYRLKNWRDTQEAVLDSDERIETLSLRYFRQVQRLGIVRFWIYISFAVLASLMYDIHSFSYLALLAGGLVISLKEAVSSLAAYFFIASRYEIGDDVRIKDTLGEIIRIRPLSVSMLGKEDSGDHDGKLITIPNYLFMMDMVQRQELKHDNHRMIILTAVYRKSEFGIPFQDFLAQLKIYLEEYLPKRNSSQVGHYKTFSGSKFKLNYDYDGEGDVCIKIRFVSSPILSSERKEHIITFIESLRT